MSWNKEEFFQNLRDLVNHLILTGPSFWHYELFSVDKNPITVGNALIGLVFVILGYISIRLIVKYFEMKVLVRLDIDAPQRYTIKVFLFYFLLILLFLFTLHLVQVPLTVFALIGTAVAVGVGFGAKNIINNFISGVVIVVEHPVRVGDLIEIDNLIGIVENTGFRSTHIRSLDNTHFIVPNSRILEENVLNWTLSDRVVRCEVKVGVVYGSPVKKIQTLLLQIAKEHDRVLTYNKQQEPLVLFSDFAANALEFTLVFWITVERPLDIKKTASDIRFRVDEIFRQENIVIAFPQRDIHIKQPVSVRMYSEALPEEKGK